MAARARHDPASVEPVESPERARELALRILGSAPRSAAQLREGLLKRNVTDAAIDEVIERYTDVGLLNDPELSATIARTRHQERGASRRAIGQELRRKGFEQPDIDAALAQISDDSEISRAHELASKRWKKLEGVDHDARVRRTVAMLGRQGYSPSVAFGVVKSLDNADSDGTRSL
jgi:regulatory protein